MNKQNCPHCLTTYASEKWLLKHLKKCEKNVKMGQVRGDRSEKAESEYKNKKESD